MDEVSGRIVAIRFHRDSFLIAVLDNAMTIKGSMVEIQEGVDYIFQGNMVDDKKWGRQFHFTSYQTKKPVSRAAVLYYLSRNAKWIGPETASKLYGKFGEDTLTILKEQPEMAAKAIKGLSLEHANEASQMLRDSEQGEKAMLDLKDTLGDAKVSQGQISSMLDLWGYQAAEYVRKNPYVLSELVRGIGFHTADMIASTLGYARDGEPRIRAGLLHVLQESQMQGHVYLPEDRLIGSAYDLLCIDKEKIESVLPDMENLVNDNNCWYNRDSFLDEIYIAQKLNILLQANPAVYHIHSNMDGLYDDQVEALTKSFASNVFIVTGAPGVGKTHLIKEIIKSCGQISTALCAPTGKAAKRMYEQSGMVAKTIHALLEPWPVKGGMEFQRNKNSPLDEKLIIVDESSMIDNWLMASLLRAIKPGSKVVFVGDSNQLPAVGAGNVLLSMIESERIPHAELTIIKRQDPGLIIRNCHAIRHGAGDIDYTGALDFAFMEAEYTEDMVNLVKDIYNSCKGKQCKLINGSPLSDAIDHYISENGDVNILRDIQIITPLRSKTLLSVAELNPVLQSLLNPKFKSSKSKLYSVGDKVIQRKNDYSLGIINGDIGFIAEVDFINNEYIVDFENPERKGIEIPFKGNNLELAYVITCHSAQGSEWPIVVIPIHGSFGALIMQRNWLYTAISRASKLCIVIGQSREIPKIISRNRQQLRYTQLAEKINPDIEIW